MERMEMEQPDPKAYAELIAGEINAAARQVAAAVTLLDEGSTIPFIARYRKEVTGGLDEVALTTVRDRLGQLRDLDARRAAIVKSLTERELLTPELAAKVNAAATLAVLEDIYLPFRPKRRTKATVAKERGLEPLALAIWVQDPALDPTAEAAAFVNPEAEVPDAAAALAGARDIMAEMVNEDPAARAAVRQLFLDQGRIVSRVIEGHEEEGAKFRDYFDWSEPLAAAPSHRVLAMRRGEKEGHLALKFAPEEEAALALLKGMFLKNDSPAGQEVDAAVIDAYKRLLARSMETEVRLWSKKEADLEAVKVFADNLRHLLMDAPLGQKRMLALDPGFRTGCKLVCLDAQGNLLHHDVIHIMSEAQQAEAKAKLLRLAGEYQIEAVAIGNGTASRETEALVRSAGLAPGVLVVMVNESGASVYSASEVARRELPDVDLTVRGAVSIGRRLMDPLAELVKIDPKAIGVGQYQHDVDQKELKGRLEDVVVSAVNRVGVELNTASPELLGYVSGLSAGLAGNIVEFRRANGPFPSRRHLTLVPRLGPKAFEQAAGFLRVRDGEHPLDATAVHPESYPVVEAMAADLGVEVKALVRNQDLIAKIDLARYVTEQVGLPTLQDIVAELQKPGRDPREKFEAFSFAEGVENLADLVPGMKLPGIVTNVTNFGAFVDVGVHQDGLVHVSELADEYVADPRQKVKVQDRVLVTVLDVDQARGRISLSMRANPGADRRSRPAAPPAEGDRRPPARSGGGKGRGKARPRDNGAPAPAPTGTKTGGSPFNDAFARAFKDLKKS
ncbi:MAG: RNA-binding transcriptional accessory protein [Deltaproteobacteria bacterium]|nr:RNA-binding transcriptional accessory protein [Deltaproteobacteria bacterium]